MRLGVHPQRSNVAEMWTSIPKSPRFPLGGKVMQLGAAGLLAEDFWNPSPDSKSSLSVKKDFWSPVNDEPGRTPCASSFWDFEDTVVTESAAIEDWNPSVLPWFDADRAENPRALVFRPPTAEHLALKRGRWISLMLDIPDAEGRRRCSEFLQEVFMRFPSRAAFQALADLALAGTAAQDFIDGCRFRMELMDHPYFAVRRNRWHPPYTPHDTQVLLSWPRAVRLAELAGCDPMHCIDDDWLTNWNSLHPDHEAYWSFVDYIEWQLRAAARYSSVAYERLPSADRKKFRALLGTATPKSRTASLIKLDKGHIGVLDSEPTRPKIIRRTRL